ncbi:MAG TPA: hypothetical protein VGR47_05825 [Terracidiphilus sp.]|nr:hypothetical protein [Terracidiphilus sp.]
MSAESSDRGNEKAHSKGSRGVRVTTLRAGVCRFCGCDDLHPARLANGDACGWIDATRTVCSHPCCMREWERKRAAMEARPRSRYSGWGYGAIVDDLRKRARQARRNRRGG